MATGTSVKVAIVGAGSIGLRHQKILGGLNHEVVLISRHNPSANYESLENALVNEHFDYVVIASETSRHTNDLNSLINNGFAGQVLVEKPLFAKSGRLQENIFAMAAVGYNLRFHPAILWLKQLSQVLAPSHRRTYMWVNICQIGDQVLITGNQVRHAMSQVVAFCVI